MRNFQLPLYGKSLFLAMVFIVMTSCQPAPDGRRPVTDQTTLIDVLSFNIRYGLADDGINSWPNRNTMVFQTIREIDPDFIGLQEALRFQIDEIREALPRYAEIGVSRDDGNTEGEYSAILYDRNKYSVLRTETFWFSDTPHTPGSADWGNTYPRICTWGYFSHVTTGERFYVYNVHLDHQSQTSREKSVMALANEIANRSTDDPFVITGDFNADEGNNAIIYLKGETASGEMSGTTAPIHVKDTYRDLHPDVGNTGTFNAFEGLTDGPKIDYIFVPEEVKVVDAQIIRRSFDLLYPSDHFPVFARIAL